MFFYLAPHEMGKVERAVQKLEEYKAWRGGMGWEEGNVVQV